jgi:predicted dehydrogenase
VSLTVAVLGTGSIGSRHLVVAQRVPGVTVVAVPARRSRVVELRRAGYTAAIDLDEAVARGASLCIVATDTARHVDDASAAMRRGLDVLVEKPLAATTEGAARVVHEACSLGRRLYVASPLRFSASLAVFRDLLPKIGRVHAVRVESGSFLPEWRPQRPYLESYSARPEQGGVLRDLVHDIDYAAWLFGWPAALQASVRAQGRLGTRVDEAADLWWETADGALVSVSLDYLSRPARRRMRACGDDGTLEWDALTQTVTLTAGAGASTLHSGRQDRDERLLAQLEAFIRSAGNGEHDARLATAGEGFRAVAVCDAARRASARGMREPVEAG